MISGRGHSISIRIGCRMGSGMLLRLRLLVLVLRLGFKAAVGNWLLGCRSIEKALRGMILYLIFSECYLLNFGNKESWQMHDR